MTACRSRLLSTRGRECTGGRRWSGSCRSMIVHWSSKHDNDGAPRRLHAGADVEVEITLRHAVILGLGQYEPVGPTEGGKTGDYEVGRAISSSRIGGRRWRSSVKFPREREGAAAPDRSHERGCRSTLFSRKERKNGSMRRAVAGF